MTKSDIINEVSHNIGLTKVETEAVLEGLIASISKALKKGNRVDIRGFGSFIIKERKAREARNPSTNKVVNLNFGKGITIYSIFLYCFNLNIMSLYTFHAKIIR